MIETLKERFEIIDGVLVWKTGRNKGLNAGYDNGKGYLKLRIQGVPYYVHKIAFALYNGYYPEHMVDHFDHNTKNNSEDNLLKSSSVHNGKNQKLRHDSPTKTLGVSFIKSRKRWKVRIGQRHIGYFKTEAEAIVARKDAEVEEGYSENHGIILNG